MASETLFTLDAVLQGLHTLAETAETVQDEALRHRLTGTIIGLRAAILTARDQILQREEQYEQLLAQSRQPFESAAAPRRERPPRVKWGCYQFDDIEGLFCAACYDQQGRRIRTMPGKTGVVCPNCRTIFPSR